MGNRLKELREERGWTHERAAEFFGLSRSGYVKLERGERKLTDDRIQKAMEIYGVGVTAVIGEDEPQVPLMGYVGAGAEIYQFDEDGGGYVDAPPGAGKSTVAVEVRGTSMFPLYEDGTLLYYSKQLPPGDMVGKRCIVRLADDRVLVKTLRRSSVHGLFTLVSTNAPDIEDVAVQWAAPIEWIKPR